MRMGGRKRRADAPTTEGQRLLLEVPGSLAELGARLGCARQMVSCWRRGTKLPGDTNRRLLEQHFGIPPGAWERAPGSRAPSNPKPTRKRPAAPAAVPRAEVDGPSTMAEVQAEIEELRALRDEELTTSEKVRVADAMTKQLALKARLERDRELFEDRVIRRSAWWASLEERILAALKPYPDAARAVAEALAPEEEESAA